VRVLPYNGRFRAALVAGWLAKPFAPLFAALGLKRLAALVRLTPTGRLAPPAVFAGKVFPAQDASQGKRRGRVALLAGCINPVLSPSTLEATVRVLNRHGIEVVVAAEDSCCGSLSHHMGREREALALARNNIDAWIREAEGEGLDAILVTVSGCGTVIKDYGFMLRTDPAYAEKAKRVSALTRDISEYLAGLKLEPARKLALTVAYHAACSLQHGQKIVREPKDLLAKLGFTVKDIPEGHLCCGSAGTYNVMQPELARALRDRKVANIRRVQPDIIAAGNIGCITQIGGGIEIPIVHTVELLDWATGGPQPEALKGVEATMPDAVREGRVTVTA
jgi:glycolate oxidase iron-sulfur subunit